MDLFNTFATDEKLEIEGRFVPFDDKTTFKIARAYNKHFNKLFQTLYKKNKAVLDTKGAAAEKLADAIMCETMAKTILLDWKGPVKIKGEDLGPYSEAGAIKALEFKGFREWVQAQADDAAAFKIVQDEEELKN